MNKLFFIFILCTTLNVHSQSLQMNQVNLFTLKVDYDQPAFEGGNTSYYTCVECTNDSLPFVVNFSQTWDFANMYFTLDHTNDTLFAGGIFWMGNGQITAPSSFSLNAPFIDQQNAQAFPTSIELFDENGIKSTDALLMSQAQLAWEQIDQLEIVNEAMIMGFNVGMYLYTPSVGMTDYSVAKWIVFFYQNVNEASLSELDSEQRVYPNPTQSRIYFTNSSNEKWILLNALAEQILVTNEESLDVSNLPSSIYYLKKASSSQALIKIVKY